MTLLVSGLVALPAPTQAAVLTESQMQAIISLISSFGADAVTVKNVEASLRGQATTGSSSTSGTSASGSACIALSFDLYLDRTDAQTNGEITKLQQFLAQDSSIYPEGRVTGYFGPATERALQRWQSMKGVVSSGDADTTGYGYIGPKTRAALACGGNTSNTNTRKIAITPAINSFIASPTSVSSGQAVTLSWGTSLATDCGILRDTYHWVAQHLGTSGSYTVYPTTSTTYTLSCLGTADGSGKDAPGAQQNAFVSVTGSTAVTPSIIVTKVSLPYIYVTYANIANTEVDLVSKSSGNVVHNQGITGTSGTVTIQVQQSLSTGYYFFRVLKKYGDGGTLIESTPFQIEGAPPQTNPVTINSFSASQTSITSGIPVTFTWSSNLTSNDISYYGGGCGISALTSSNQQIHITSGATSGANGSVTYTPSLTATYTLTCSSGGKDGSPMNTKQVAVKMTESSTFATITTDYGDTAIHASESDPWIYGTASPATSIRIVITNASGKTAYDSGLFSTNGQWNIRVNPPIPFGNYTVTAQNVSGQVLASVPLSILGL